MPEHLPPPARPARRSFVPFRPILAGATWRERLWACLGALVGIGLAGFVSARIAGLEAAIPLIVAPIGASAVLLFAVPASPLAQPWPIIGGNTISALVGVAVAKAVPDPVFATGLAVALAIAAMSLTRSLHPPGGAAALTAVIGGPAIKAAGFSFALMPVALNSILLVAVGLVFHRLAQRSYPHRPPPSPANAHATADPPADARVGLRSEDIAAALVDLDETFDIDPADLDRLLRVAERRALLRASGEISCAAIMSRDVVTIAVTAPADAARKLLLDHALRSLPVVDEAGRLAGIVGLRELATGVASVREAMRPAVTAAPQDAALGLVSAFSDPSTRAVVVVDAGDAIVGLITQTDLLALLVRKALGRDPAPVAPPASA